MSQIRLDGMRVRPTTMAAVVIALLSLVGPRVMSAAAQECLDQASGTSSGSSEGAEAQAATLVAEQKTYTWWSHPSAPAAGFRKMNSRIFVEIEPTRRTGQADPAYFHSHQFHFLGPDSDGGYIGIQKDKYGRRAIFSIWRATAATCSTVSGAKCQPFGGEGSGYQTIIPYNWVDGSYYLLKLVRNSSNWRKWIGRIEDVATGVSTDIGTITIPDGWGNVGPGGVNWTEWYGPQQSLCSQYPRSSVWFAPTEGTTEDGTVQTAVLGGNEVTPQESCPSSVAGPARPTWLHLRGHGPAVSGVRSAEEAGSTGSVALSEDGSEIPDWQRPDWWQRWPGTEILPDSPSTCPDPGLSGS